MSQNQIDCTALRACMSTALPARSQRRRWQLIQCRAGQCFQGVRNTRGFHDLVLYRVNLRVRLVPLPHNWIKLPQSYVNHFLELKKDLQAVFRLKRVPAAERDCLVAWNGLVCHEPGSIEIPQALASGLGLHEGDVVDPEHVTGLPKATLVHVTVASADDWAVIESNAANLTAALLQQLKVVRKGDTLPVWIRGQSSVDIRVVSAQPADAVVLSNDSIVSVEPPAPQPADPMLANGLLGPDSDNEGTGTPKNAANGNLINSEFKFGTPAIMQGPMRLRVRVCNSLPEMYPICSSSAFTFSWNSLAQPGTSHQNDQQ